MAIERTEPLVFDGSFIERYVMVCKSLDEARRSLPELTREQYRAIRAGRAHFVGDSKAGITYVPQPRGAVDPADDAVFVCRDCGRPCTFEKDSEGFHVTQEED